MRARVSTSAVGLALALTVSLSACSTGAQEQASPAGGSPSPAATVDTDQLLAEVGLDGRSGQEIVEELERSPEPRPLAVGASVREDHVLVSDGTQEVAVPLPEDAFYVSVAPFVEETHECFYHSLATCRGELAGEEVSVLISDGDGQVLVDETVTTGANGFTGFWLPRGIEGGTIEVTADGLEGSVPLATTPGSPTCVTTLQLAPVEA
ncbi:CueP family metal-binding protein [Ornithinimicrobium pekingense]|uniref:CueP family metal-binding protein n=1 Tax=Ornithinimicrobium pekingense TaxID=384677 RepID=A0ABQ2FAH0_9MICO|nr:CueP family metal-binding protein [Ornithinimicrobium pekingense]GGK75161.1 hypothetical protein GCM10011509_24800 [Ornithinimicrobium pekingense]